MLPLYTNRPLRSATNETSYLFIYSGEMNFTEILMALWLSWYSRVGRPFKFRCWRMMYAVWNSRFARRFYVTFAYARLLNRSGELLVIYETDYPNENQILFHVCRIQRQTSHWLTCAINYRLPWLLLYNRRVHGRNRFEILTYIRFVNLLLINIYLNRY